MKQDFVTDLVAVVRDCVVLDDRTAEKIDETIRASFGGRVARIASQPPITVEDIDAALRTRQTVREIASALGVSRATIYRKLSRNYRKKATVKPLE